MPTKAESGYPNANVVWWGSISGPPKLPAFIVAKWEKAIEETLGDPEVIAEMKKLGLTSDYHNAHETGEIVIKGTDEINKLYGLMK